MRGSWLISPGLGSSNGNCPMLDLIINAPFFQNPIADVSEMGRKWIGRYTLRELGIIWVARLVPYIAIR